VLFLLRRHLITMWDAWTRTENVSVSTYIHSITILVTYHYWELNCCSNDTVSKWVGLQTDRTVRPLEHIYCRFWNVSISSYQTELEGGNDKQNYKKNYRFLTFHDLHISPLPVVSLKINCELSIDFPELE
jgi:hypothetical protein